MSEKPERVPSLQEALETMASRSDSGLQQAVAVRRRYVEGDALETIARDFAIGESDAEQLTRDGLRALLRILRNRRGKTYAL
jgi:hypothetical protein